MYAIRSYYVTTLTIAGCNGPDSLNFLSGLTRLTTLAVEDATATDLTPIAALTGLETLSVYGCPVTDYTPVSTLTALEKLYCGEEAALPEP